jgi:predicted cytidylate kinase
MKYSKITISGKICTGKSTLFNSLKEKLKWPTFSSGQQFREFAQKNKLNLVRAQEQNDTLTKKIDNKAKKLLHKPGNLLVDAWLGGILASNLPDVLKILLTADDETRFKRFSKRENLQFDEAEKQVLERDENWFNRVSDIYGRNDFFDIKHYNLIIDTSNKSPEQITELVLDRLGFNHNYS